MHTTHGKTRTPEHIVWLGMLDRCRNTNHPAYPRYGGRGIKVCDQWSNSFPNFLEDMGERPSLSHTLDRIDNDGNYEPENCRWATKKEQANNRRKNVTLNVGGTVLTVSEFCTLHNLPEQRFRKVLLSSPTADPMLIAEFCRTTKAGKRFKFWAR